ncbi:MAG: MFS transporter [Actinomycetia bacterium]|nr:MFS transporter [Actinomycetes bacterium]
MGVNPKTERGVLASVRPLFIGLALLMVGNGLLGSLLGIRAHLEGFPTVVIGVVMAMYYVGFLFGSLTIPRRLQQVGHIRVFAGLSSLAAATALAYSLLANPLVWGMLRFAFGLAMSGLYVTMESWLNERSTNETRGRLLSTYMLIVTIGLGLGPLLLGLDDPLNATLFILVGILISLAVVPVALIRIATPRETIPVKFSVISLARTAPLGVMAVVISGAAGSAVATLGALYATKIGMAPGLVGVFVAVSLVGAAATQYPLGSLSDRFPRRRVILAASVGAMVFAGIAIFVDSSGIWPFLLIAAYGSLVFPMYSLAVSMINDVIPENQLVAAAAGIVFVYGAGSVVGPVGVSILMDVLGPVGYFWGLAVTFLPLAVYALARIIFTSRPRQRRFISLPFRSSTAAALLAEPSDEDARSDPHQP